MCFDVSALSLVPAASHVRPWCCYRCILDIPTSVGADARHFDTATSGGGDWLVSKLQALIDAGFKMASGAVEALRPLGVQLLQARLQSCLIPVFLQKEGQQTMERHADLPEALGSTLDPQSCVKEKKCIRPFPMCEFLISFWRIRFSDALCLVMLIICQRAECLC